jgi:hypothetical protein
MRLPRVRFTIMRSMLAVAFIAVLIGVVSEGARWRRRREYAMYWAGFHAHLESTIQSGCRPGCPHSVDSNPRSDYHAQLRREYERAVRYPWAGFPVDPLKDRWEE